MIQTQMHGLQESKLYAWITFKLRFCQSFEKSRIFSPMYFSSILVTGIKSTFIILLLLQVRNKKPIVKFFLLVKSLAITYTQKKMLMQKTDGLLVMFTYFVIILLLDQNLSNHQRAE